MTPRWLSPAYVVWMPSCGPANNIHLRAALDIKGQPEALLYRIAGPKRSLGGVSIPYGIPNLRTETVEVDVGVPDGPWHSVGASQNAFPIECFIDELAHAAGADPLKCRLKLLASQPRHRAVLELAATKSGWGRPLAAGQGRGIAVYHSYAGWVGLRTWRKYGLLEKASACSALWLLWIVALLSIRILSWHRPKVQ